MLAEPFRGVFTQVPGYDPSRGQAAQYGSRVAEGRIVPAGLNANVCPTLFEGSAPTQLLPSSQSPSSEKSAPPIRARF